MEKSFTWEQFDKISRMMEAVGYLILIFGPLIGLGVLIFASGLVKIIGLLILLGSVVIALYHISISFLMYGMRHLCKTNRPEEE